MLTRPITLALVMLTALLYLLILLIALPGTALFAGVQALAMLIKRGHGFAVRSFSKLLGD